MHCARQQATAAITITIISCIMPMQAIRRRRRRQRAQGCRFTLGGGGVVSVPRSIARGVEASHVRPEVQARQQLVARAVDRPRAALLCFARQNAKRRTITTSRRRWPAPSDLCARGSGGSGFEFAQKSALTRLAGRRRRRRSHSTCSAAPDRVSASGGHSAQLTPARVAAAPTGSRQATIKSGARAAVQAGKRQAATHTHTVGVLCVCGAGWLCVRAGKSAP